ncbi:SCP-like protein, partial [Ancylostoma duodenale]
ATVESLVTLDFQCWNFGQENDIRQEYRNQVNDLRSDLAKGDAPNKGGKKCPAGKNIYRLDWDCMLENIAQKAVDQCVEKPKLMPKEEETLSMVYSKKPLTTCNPMPLFRKQVKEWWNVSTTVGLDNNAAFKSGLESFAVLANGLSTRIGCAQKNCNGDLHMACVVYGKAATTGQAIYEVGQGCTSDSECTTYEGSTCKKQKQFCAAGYPKNGTVVPPTVGTTTTTTPTTTKYCEKQEDMNADPAREELLRLHNQYRAAVAKGEVTMGNKNKARPCPRMKKFAVTTWYGEITSNGAHMDQKPGSKNLLLPELNIRHFARMVWDTNAEMGCAIVRCGKKWNVVCRYGEGVGKFGNQIYFMGPSCRQCKTCEEGLCTA